MARSTLAVTLVAASLIAGPSIAAGTEQHTFVTIRLADFGVARGNGVAAISVFVACGGGAALEALLTLSQDDQATFGQGSMGVLTCDGVERAYSVRMRALSGTFHGGPAFASTYALICGASACATGGASQTVTLRGRPM